MSEKLDSLKDDIAFLRELARDDGTGLARDGAAMIIVGLVFGCVTLTYWLFFTGHAAGLAPVVPWLWAGGVAVMILASVIVNRRLPRGPGAASRAMAAAWGGTGVSLIAPCLGLILGGGRMGNPQLVLWVFPVILFTLYGAGWTVAWAVKRRPWLLLVGAGCFATAFAEGALVSSPHQWLVLAAGLVLWVASPGAVILRQARAGRG